MEFGEAVREFEEFFSQEWYETVADAVQEGEDSVVVDFQALDVFNPELADYLQEEPDSALDAASQGVEGVDIVSDEEFRIRFTDMPEEDFVKIKNLRSEHIGSFVPIEGMIKRASQVKPELTEAEFECTQCGDLHVKEQDSTELKSPYKCECGSRKFDVVDKKMTDTQNVVLEENPESREGSEQPATLNVRLEGDLVDPDFQKKVVPGNVANITGVVREKPFQKNSKKYDMYLEANFLDPTEQEFEELELEEDEIERIKSLAENDDIFQMIANSIAPSIHGHDKIKEAVALQMFGGVKKTREDGVESRGDIHILLIGEPGTGKSQILKFTGELAPKGRYVVGKSSTGAGLTAAAVRNEQTGEFELEAGAIVLANKGLAAVDEIDKMSSEDRSSMHEAMEQQQISVAKANIQATLNAQTSILAAGNPTHGRFDPYEPVAQQIDIGDTLLSRFDFIFPVKDEPDQEKDTELSEQVLQNHIEPEELDADIEAETLRKYVAYAKKNLSPQLTQDAADHIQEFYVSMRESGSEEGDSVPITPRQLEALIRVAEASAKSELRDEVLEKDAQRAIDILTYCLKQIGVDPETGDYDIDMIESGVSSSQRNRLQTLKQIIRAEGGDDEAVEVDEIIEAAESEGIDRDKAEEIIQRMKREGDLWEPQPGHVQQV